MTPKTRGKNAGKPRENGKVVVSNLGEIKTWVQTTCGPQYVSAKRKSQGVALGELRRGAVNTAPHNMREVASDWQVRADVGETWECYHSVTGGGGMFNGVAVR